jgi:hypothetical protein
MNSWSAPFACSSMGPNSVPGKPAGNGQPAYLALLGTDRRPGGRRRDRDDDPCRGEAHLHPISAAILFVTCRRAPVIVPLSAPGEVASCRRHNATSIGGETQAFHTVLGLEIHRVTLSAISITRPMFFAGVVLVEGAAGSFWCQPRRCGRFDLDAHGDSVRRTGHRRAVPQASGRPG